MLPEKVKHFMDPAQPLPIPIADFDDQCGECPVWDPETQSLYWTDCVGLKFCRFHEPTGVSEVVRKGFEVYGFRRHVAGGWVVTNPSGLWWWNGSDEPVRRRSKADGEPLSLNDCCVDRRGRLIAATFFYNPGTDYRLGHLVLFDLDGDARLLDGGFHLANGIAFSPDGSVLYATDTVARRIYAYDYDEAAGSVGNQRVLVELSPRDGIPDGLAVDSAGCLWSAIWYGGRVNRYTPDGRLERVVELPAKQPSSVAFGGPELRQIYITTAAHSETLPVMPPGYDPANGPFGGALFRADACCAGLPQRPAAIRFSGGNA
jgi:D-xylonolactonase